MSNQSPAYIEPSVLADKIKSGNHGDIMIVDVRDVEEFDEGHIIGANLRPSENWNNSTYVDSAIADAQNTGCKTVVFHCMKSQVRGPTCARQFIDRLQFLPEENRPQV